MEKLERLKVVRRVDTTKEAPPRFTCSVVLVPKGEEFRACANVPDVNHRTSPPVHPLPNCQEILDEVGQSKVLSALDCSNGFHNIPLDPSCEKYCGIITQDGVWVY